MGRPGDNFDAAFNDPRLYYLLFLLLFTLRAPTMFIYRLSIIDLCQHIFLVGRD